MPGTTPRNRVPSSSLALGIGIGCVLALGIGCQTTVDTSGLDPLTGYDQWYRIDTSGPVPGHGDSYRVIYANDTARGYIHSGRYPVGSVIVKEIRDDNDGQAGDLRYLGVMRKLAESALPDVELEGGWLFTMMPELGDDEVQGFSCWNRCHRQAPIDGAWLDYGM